MKDLQLAGGGMRVQRGDLSFLFLKPQSTYTIKCRLIPFTMAIPVVGLTKGRSEQTVGAPSLIEWWQILSSCSQFTDSAL